MTEDITELDIINLKAINQIANIIILSNKDTLIAKLGEKFVKKFLKFCILSNKAKIFIYKIDNNIIAYSIIFKKERYLIEELKKIKYEIFLHTVLKFKFKLFIDLILIYLNKDLVINDLANLEILKEAPNLTYLAVKEEFRNKGIGKIFLDYIFVNYYKNQYMSVETNNKKTLNFYLKYIYFKEIGYRKRSKDRLYLLLKKLS